mmetsp:Transcript_4054/g.25448  ORF Transcript_4054/g.25448 Transcript_4054/m.25448 type:complete len:267 (+) Transcript_4054:261-1061(+)
MEKRNERHEYEDKLQEISEEKRKRKGKETWMERHQEPCSEPKRKMRKQDTCLPQLHEWILQEKFEDAWRLLKCIAQEETLSKDLQRVEAIVRVHRHARHARWKEGLGIHGKDRPVDTTEVKEKYRNLALLLHPDKSTLPRSQEAFVLAGECYMKLMEESEALDFLEEDKETDDADYDNFKEHILTEAQFASICSELGAYPLVSATEATLANAIIALQQRVLQRCEEMEDRKSAIQMNQALSRIRHLLAKRKKKSLKNTFKAAGGFM